MSRESLGVVSGLIVMLAGAMTVWAITTLAGPEPAASTTADAAVTSTTATQSVEIALPDLPGVPPEVERVLYATGKAQPIAFGDLNGIPPEVQRVLIEFQAPLMVPTSDPQGASK